MNSVQRALISITRKREKTIIYLLLVLIFANLIVGAFSIRQAVRQTEANMMTEILPIATIGNNIEEMLNYNRLTGNIADVKNLGVETINEIGSLSYVSFFDATIDERLFSRYLTRTENLSFNPLLMDDSFLFTMQQMIDSEAGRIHQREEIEPFWIRGVSNPDFIHYRSGLIQILEGNNFTEKQINNSEEVVLISRQLAMENNLEVGSILPMEANFYRGWGPFTDANVWVSHKIELTVIGIFDVNFDFFEYDRLEPEVAGTEELRLINRLYVPFGIAERANRIVFEAWRETDPSIDDDANFEDYRNIWTLFYLYDSRTLPDFALAAQNYLPEFWEIQDLSQTFGNLTVAMENMIWIFDWTFYIATSAMCVIIGLLLMLFLRDRKREIGIYLALGERRSRVIRQIILEVISLSTISLLLSFHTGNLLSNRLSQQLLETELVQQRQEMMNSEGWYYGIVPFHLTVFHREMTTDEMLAAFDVSMSPAQFLTFYGMGLGIILISTLIPIIYIIRLNPKKILM